MPLRPSSQAQRDAVRKHDSTVVDKVTARLPKGTKERILATGMNVNTFLISAVEEKLERMSKTTSKPQEEKEQINTVKPTPENDYDPSLEPTREPAEDIP